MAATTARAARARSGLSALLVLLASFAGVVLSAWWLEGWRGRERERRLRQVHTLTGLVDEYPAPGASPLGGGRGVSVSLPRAYLVCLDGRFPVLYLQDGENAFDGATATVAGQEWQLDETAHRMAAAGRLQPLIMVAVDSAGTGREAEYSPPRIPADAGTSGADLYAGMLVDELKPWIDRRYRTATGRESTGIAGTSLGGLAALYLALRHPDVFSRVAWLSPTGGWQDDALVRFLDVLPEKTPTRVWLEVGAEEGAPALAAARRLRDALVRKGWREGIDLSYREAPGARADAGSWARQFPGALAFLFPAGKEAAAAPSR